MNLFTLDDIGSLNLTFSPDPISRFQYEKVHGAKQDQADHEAVRMLMLAVLEDGIACFQDYFFQPSRTNEKLFHEADEWIHSNDDGVFSFNNICEALGLCPEKLRKGLEGWKAKQAGVHPKEKNVSFSTKGNAQERRKRKQLEDRRLLSMNSQQIAREVS